MGARMALMTRLIRLGASAALIVGLAACGSETGGKLNLGETIKLLRPQQKVETPGVTDADVASALATPGPVEYVARPDQKGWSFLLELDRNGDYVTYGNANRQTFTMKRGIVTATRGLSGDLMSSDVDQVLALISARKPGTAPRVMRFLDGENQTVSVTLTCTVTPGGSRQVASGTLKTRATQVSETCTAGSRRFTNTYLVDATGRSVGSQQWLGATTGPLVFQTLRR